MTGEPVRIVEAALFSAGKPLTEQEITDTTKVPLADVKAALHTLMKEYAERDTALEVVKSGVKWAMAVRASYSESTKMLAAPEIPRKVLKTLALIAFHQPIKQSDLKDMIGSVVYDHVGELHDRGMVTARQEGMTKILQTTERFCEYFGIDAANRDEIRVKLAEKVGLVLPPPTVPAEPQSTLPHDGGSGADAAEPSEPAATDEKPAEQAAATPPATL